MDENQRLKIERTLAMAQCRDIARQFNNEVEHASRLETILLRLENRLSEFCPTCSGEIGRVLYERDRADDKAKTASAQAEHFLQQRIALEQTVNDLEQRLAHALARLSPGE